MLTIILAIILGSGSRQSLPSQQVDLIELNHCVSDCGRELFTQVIFRNWSPDYRRQSEMSGGCLPRSCGTVLFQLVKSGGCE